MSSEYEREIELLKEFYGITDHERIPQERCFDEWKDENKFGFFLGIFRYGEEEHREEVEKTLRDGSFADKEEDLVDELISYYIEPFCDETQGRGNDSTRDRLRDSSGKRRAYKELIRFTPKRGCFE